MISALYDVKQTENQMDEKKYDILHQIHPILRQYITYIWAHGKTGVCSGNMQVLKVSSNVKNDEGIDTKYANILTLSIPYAGHYLQWEVKFSMDNLYFAPDFLIDDDEFLNEYDSASISEKLPSWANWNSKDPSSLHKVLTELIDLYKKYQVTLLEQEKYSRLHFEFSSLVGETGVGKDDIEVLVEPSGVVHFLISLSTDLTCLPSDIYRTADTMGKNLGSQPSAVLMVTFKKTDGTNVQPHLFISPLVEQTLLGVTNKPFLPFPTNGCLMDYVPAIRRLLEDRIQFIVDNYTLKKQYIAQLLANYSSNILEFDSFNFSKACLLFETNEYYWILIIDISNNFPKEKPKLTLKSNYQMPFDEPFTEVLHDYPYSPRWLPEEMITRAIKYSSDRIHQFQLKEK